MTDVGLYVRVSDPDQDDRRQIEEGREYVESRFDDANVSVYADVVTGTSEAGGDEYNRLWSDVGDERFDVLVVHELSRVSRLGPAAIHELLEHALENETSVYDMETGLEIDLGGTVVDQEVKKMIAGIMGSLARVEHKQKLRRINSGIRAAQNAGVWTGRPPKGFRVDDETSTLHVDPVEFLETRQALERVVDGESVASVSRDSGIPESTLRNLRDGRLDLYFYGEADDDRVDQALDDVRPLDEPAADPEADVDDLTERVRRLEARVDDANPGGEP